MSLKIKEMWAYISVDEDGNEGVFAAQLGPDFMCPLVGADKARMESLRAVAQDIVDETGVGCKLVRFHHCTVEEEISPSVPEVAQ